MASVLRVLNWFIRQLTDQYGKLEESEPAQLPHAKTQTPGDDHKPY